MRCPSISSSEYQINQINEREVRMSDKTKRTIRAISTGITILGVCGLWISGSTEANVSSAVKVGTMIASIIGSIITLALPRNK